jgi:hypothetical protein
VIDICSTDVHCDICFMIFIPMTLVLTNLVLTFVLTILVLTFVLTILVLTFVLVILAVAFVLTTLVLAFLSTLIQSFVPTIVVLAFFVLTSNDMHFNCICSDDMCSKYSVKLHFYSQLI